MTTNYKEKQSICSQAFSSEGHCLEYDGGHPFCKKDRGCKRQQTTKYKGSSTSIEDMAVIPGTD